MYKGSAPGIPNTRMQLNIYCTFSSTLKGWYFNKPASARWDIFLFKYISDGQDSAPENVSGSSNEEQTC